MIESKHSDRAKLSDWTVLSNVVLFFSFAIVKLRKKRNRFTKKPMHFALKRCTKADAVFAIATVSEGKELDL